MKNIWPYLLHKLSMRNGSSYKIICSLNIIHFVTSYTFNGTFLALIFANVSIILVKSIVLASSDSMLNKLSETSRSCVELFLSLFFLQNSACTDDIWSPLTGFQSMDKGPLSHIYATIHLWASLPRNPAQMPFELLLRTRGLSDLTFGPHDRGSNAQMICQAPWRVPQNKDEFVPTQGAPQLNMP